MTNTTISAPEANRLRNRARAQFAEAEADVKNIRGWVEAGSGSFSTQDLLTAEKTLAIKKQSLAAAEQAAKQANSSIEATDDQVAHYLMELFEDHRAEFRLDGVHFDKRKRPGKDIPRTLPEVVFCQQANSTFSSGAITGECFVVIYGTNHGLPKLDPKIIADASSKLGGILEIDNTNQPEVLGQTEDGTEVVRKQYRVIAKHVYRKVPIIPHLPTEHEVLVVAGSIANELRSINVSSTAYGATSITQVKILTGVDEKSINVEVEGNERRATFTIMVGTAGRYGDFGYDQIVARAASRIGAFGTGRVFGNLGRVTSTSIVASTPVNGSSARLTVQMVGEAKTA